MKERSACSLVSGGRVVWREEVMDVGAFMRDSIRHTFGRRGIRQRRYTRRSQLLSNPSHVELSSMSRRRIECYIHSLQPTSSCGVEFPRNISADSAVFPYDHWHRPMA